MPGAAPRRRPIAAVVGGSQAPHEVLDAAERLGKGLVDAGFRVVTGGLGGIMLAASRGARSSTAWTEGTVVGVLPQYAAGAANPFVDIAVPTGLGQARNVVVVAMADVVVAVDGGAGTLSEMAHAWQLGKPIVALDLGDGWSSRLAGEALDDRRGDVIHRAASVVQAVELAATLAGLR